MKKIRLAMLVCAIALLFTSCGGSYSSGATADQFAAEAVDNGYYPAEDALYEAEDGYYETEDWDVAEEEPEYPEEAPAAQAELTASSAPEAGIAADGGVNEPILQDGAKLIWTASLDIQTKNYEKVLSEINGLVAKYEGYVSNSQAVDGDEYVAYDMSRSSGRYVDMELRIPSAHFQEFMNDTVGLSGTITGQNVSSYDATRTYNNNAQQIELLQTEYDYYQKLLEAATDIDDIIRLQGTMTDLLYQIRTLTQTNKDIAYDADYSTISISVQELIVSETIGMVLKVEESYKSLKIEESFAITARLVGGDVPIEYWTEDDGVATVDEKGLVKATGSGSTRIHVTAGDLEHIVDIYVAPVPPTYGSRAAEAFHESWDGFIEFWVELSIFLIGSIFQLIILAAVIVLIVFIVRKIKRSRKGKKPPKKQRGTVAPIPSDLRRPEQPTAPSEPGEEDI